MDIEKEIRDKKTNKHRYLKFENILSKIRMFENALNNPKAIGRTYTTI